VQLDDLAIPRIQEATPLAAVKAQENISFFLAALADYGVSPHKRFFMLDLWNGNSRPRVVESLAELARVAGAKKFRSTLQISDLPLEKLPNPLTQEQTKILVEQLSKTRTRETGAQRKDAPGLFKRKLQLMVSQKEFPEFERRWTRIQALMRGRAARAKYQSRVLNQAYRDRIAFELRDTEATYLSGLKICIDKYLQPLKTGSWNKKLTLSPANIKSMFSDIEIIYNVNSMLKNSIDKAMETWGPASELGNIFVSIMGFLKVYSNYVSTADAQLREYDTLLKGNKLFSQFVDEMRAQPGTLDIPGYLIMPIQRVPRYFMLLERLLKNTWKEHRDYGALEKSVTGLAEIATYLNDQKRRFENIRSVIVYQSSIIGCPQIAVPRRSLVQQFEVQDLKKKDDHLIVLFNDSILIAKTEKKKTSTTHKFKDLFEIMDVDMVPIDGDKGYDIVSKGVSALKVLASPEASTLYQKLSPTKSAWKSTLNTHSGTEDAPANEHEIVVIVEEAVTAEELLKQRETEKKQLKALVDEEMQLLKVPADALPPGSLRSSSPSRRPPVAKAVPALRSTASLMKMKAIVEQQISVLDTQLEEADSIKKEEYRKMAATLGTELAELDEKLETVKDSVSPDVREAMNQEESAVRLKVAEEPKTMRASKKTIRKSFFAFFSRSGTVNSSTSNVDSPSSGSPAKTDKGIDGKSSSAPSTPGSTTTASASGTNSATATPPSSAKLGTPPVSGKLRLSAKVEKPPEQVPTPSASPKPGSFKQ
jgi:hypothetical protein